MVSIVVVLSGLILCLVGWNFWLTRQFSNERKEWRQIERDLIDRLLRREYIQPLQIERESVLKLPDAEIQPEDWLGLAFRLDEIKEEVEQLFPEAANLSAEQVQVSYPAAWAEAELRWRTLQAPLSV